jgi:DNA-binding CsgD family transcriptional regulator
MKPRDRCMLSLCLGELHFAKGKHDRALELYQKGVELSLEIQNKRLTAIGRKDIGQIYAALGNKKRAFGELLDSLDLARELGDLSIQCEIYEALVPLYDSAGKLREALDASKELLSLKARVMLDDQQRKAMRVEAESKLEIARKEKEFAEMRAAGLEQEVTRKQRELTKIALELAEKNEIIQSVKKEIAELAAKKDTTAADSKHLRDTLDRFATSASEQWSQFEAEFEELNKALYQKLSQIAPKLTQTELKVCALLRVGLGSKDIAKILFVSHLVVYNYRFRIREKLSLAEGAHLTTYLQGLLLS